MKEPSISNSENTSTRVQLLILDHRERQTNLKTDGQTSLTHKVLFAPYRTPESAVLHSNETI
jgi:hypothetical protein